MLPSRTPSNASGHLRRSKSFSCARPQQLKHAKSFNTSELAHHQALTAAELAFQRARERHAEENGEEYSGKDYTTHTVFPLESPQLARQKSVRFTGSNAMRTRQLPHTRREVIIRQNYPEQEKIAQRPQYAEAFISSEPSSYRKLRKAKTMFAPGKPPSVISADGTNTSRAHFKHDSMRSSDSHNSPPILPDRRLHRSFSFLRGVTDRLSTTTRHYATNDAAIQIARNQYLRQLEEQRVKEQSSFTNLAGRRKSQRDFRRTVRTNSNNSHGTAMQPQPSSVVPVEVNNAGRAVRTVSQTLKRALKRVFRSQSSYESKLPEQHLSATKAYYGERFDNNDCERHLSPTPSPDIELLRRISSHESIICTATGYNETKASDGRMLSKPVVEDNSNQQSRMTSWTDSTVGDTINMSQFVERKRLSVIKEDGGPHQPSSSAGLYMDPLNGYAVFRQPVSLDNTGPATAQRVYSALQREIWKSERSVAQDDGDVRSDSGSEKTNFVPSRQGTLWRVASDHEAIDGQLATDSQMPNTPVLEPDLFVLSPNINLDNSPFHPAKGTYGLPYYGNEYIEPVYHLTPQQIALLNEPEIPALKKPLQKFKSVLSPPELEIEECASRRYNQLIHDRDEQTKHINDKQSGTKINTCISSPIELAPLRNRSTAVSESIYSRTEGGHSPRALGSSMSLPKSDSSGEGGTAIIITSGLQSPERLLPARSQLPAEFDRSIGEWKISMMPNVSFLEDHGPENDKIPNAPHVKESGHKRENAQWDVEDVNIGNPYKAFSSNLQPFERMENKMNDRPALQESMSRSNIDRFLPQDIKAINKQTATTQKENAPKKQSLTRLDKRRTVESVNETSTPANAAFDGPCSNASQTTLDPHSDEKSPPTSANSRRSPERAERLRRLQKRSSQSLHKSSSSPRISFNSNKTEPAQVPPADNLHRPDRVEQVFSSPGNQVTSSKVLVSGFLKSRRSQMRSSDESGSDPAFL